uniref:Protein kinase domain-containing protein n=1 Tax=Caenorhabditis tropicalis TaxID=1561998 RepID=A0A1I7TL42_9PELO
MSKQTGGNNAADSQKKLRSSVKRSRPVESEEQRGPGSTSADPSESSSNVQSTSTGPEVEPNQSDNREPSASDDRIQSNSSVTSNSILLTKRGEIMPNIEYQEGGFFRVEIGDTLVERYDVLRYLGRGTYATVWMVKDDIDKKYLALKITKAFPGHQETATKEVDIWLHLQKDGQHPNIVQYIDCCDLIKGPCVHLALQFEMMGPSLDIAMKKSNQKFHLEVVKRIIRQILEAMKHIHQLGVIHMDLKPSNIMMAITNKNIEDFAIDQNKTHNQYYLNVTNPDSNIIVKIADMGLSRLAETVTEPTRPACSYSPPEGFLTYKRDQSVDLWSIGCIVHQLVTGDLLIPCSKKLDDEHYTEHLALMEDVLGPIPESPFYDDLHEKGREYFNNPVRAECDTSNATLRILSDGAVAIKSKKDCTQFTKLVLSFLKHDPSQRKKAADALLHPFLNPNSGESETEKDLKNQTSSDEPGTSTSHQSTSSSRQDRNDRTSSSSKP